MRSGHLIRFEHSHFHPVSSLKQVIDDDPKSPTAKKLGDLIQAQLSAYDMLMDEHGLSEESQNRLLTKMAEYSDH